MGGEEEVLEFVRGTRLKIAGLTTFKKGTEVTAFGLENNPHLNGRVGSVAGFDDGRKRWVVDWGEGIGKKLLKESNLRPSSEPPPAPTELDLPPSAPIKPAVQESSSSEPSAANAGGPPQEAVPLKVGMRVRITGLGAKNDFLNGLFAELLEYEEERKRWIVGVDGQGRKMLREANLEALPAARPAAATGDGGPLEAPPSSGGSTGPRKLKPGVQVLVEGLEGTAWEHLVGQIGICEHCEFMSGCWTVFFATGSKAKLRPEHLVPQTPVLRPGAYVRLTGLQNARQLNGRMGICGSLDPDSQRWEVRLETGENKSLKEENLTLVDGYTHQQEGEPSENRVSATFEGLLQTGEISWLDA